MEEYKGWFIHGYKAGFIVNKLDKLREEIFLHPNGKVHGGFGTSYKLVHKTKKSAKEVIDLLTKEKQC